MAAKIVTANRLDDGFVVYLTAEGGWSERLADGVLLNDGEADARLQAVNGAGHVIGPYLIDVSLRDGVPRPRGQRETLRTLGPSVRPDLGYQAHRE